MKASWLGTGLGFGLAAAGCGGGSITGGAAGRLLSVAGDYQIEKIMVSDACEGQTGGFSNPGTVRHSPGATSFVLNDHGTRDLPGTVDTTGAFLLQPFEGQAGSVPGRDTYDGGRFTAAGFAVRVTTVVFRSRGTPPAPDCTIVMQWNGAKQGAPNVIP